MSSSQLEFTIDRCLIRAAKRRNPGVRRLARWFGMRTGGKRIIRALQFVLAFREATRR